MHAGDSSAAGVQSGVSNAGPGMWLISFIPTLGLMAGAGYLDRHSFQHR